MGSYRRGLIPVVILLIAVFGVAAVATGAVYWTKAKNKSKTDLTAQPTLDTKRAESSTLETEAETYTSTSTLKPSFTINPPSGWVRPTDILQEADYALAAPQPDRASETKGFFSNINIVITAHETGFSTIEDYRSKYAQDLVNSTPGMAVVSTASKTVNGYETFIVEATVPNGTYDVHQIQYVFVVSNAVGLAATGSTTTKTWERDGTKIKASIESIKILPSTAS
ncbi:MAG: hypothetical protein NUV80_00390 [Candidatus Berkelbacteria bacterium]|nr:hypothetical protein [Candidatus Berkelbacteria bacterium]